MAPNYCFKIELAYSPLHATPILISLEILPGTTVAEAIKASKISLQYPELEAIDLLSVGIFSRRVAVDQVLTPGDRIEIYRPLKIDPKLLRRKRSGK